MYVRCRRTFSTIVLIALTLAIAACGSSGPKVGDCIDAQKQVVDCASSSATQKLVTDQAKPNAIACVQIGSKPQVEVKVDNHPFCAESK